MIYTIFPNSKAKNNTVRFVWVNEYGMSDEIHNHILINIHPEAVNDTAQIVWDYLKELRSWHHQGIKQVHLMRIKWQPGLISYLCKKEGHTPVGDAYKAFHFSKRFKEIAAKFHNTPSYCCNGSIRTMGSQNDVYAPFRSITGPSKKALDANYEPVTDIMKLFGKDSTPPQRMKVLWKTIASSSSSSPYSPNPDSLTLLSETSSAGIKAFSKRKTSLYSSRNFGC